MLHDHFTHATTGVFFQSQCFAFNDVFVANFTPDFGDNWNTVRIPFAENLSGFYLVIFRNPKDRSGRNSVFLKFSSFRIQNRDFAVSRQNDLLTVFVFYKTQMSVFDDTALLRFNVALFHTRINRTTNVERTHGQLSTWFPDTLSSNNSDSHPLFDELTGCQVHSVATAADAKRSFTCHT